MTVSAEEPLAASRVGRPGGRWLIEATALAAALAVFLASVLPNLSNHPAVTDDEVWVLSASYKLAEDGVFGSDMFAGFYNADSHYLFNMPGHHFVLAGAFKVLGAGILQARLVGVAYGVAVLLLTYRLGRRLYGAGVALLSVGLLLFLRLNMGFDTGLPLQELAASIRYDLAPVPFALGGVLLLLGPPSIGRAVLAGALFGAATLLQFYGAFLIPVALAFLALDALPTRLKLRLGGALVGAAVAVGLPYAGYALANYTDFKGQAGTVEGRADFLSPTFYVDSVLREPKRFTRPLGFREVPRGADPRLVDPRFLSFREMMTRRPSAKLAVLVGLPLAIAFAGRRAWRERSRGDRLLVLCLVGLPVQFALFESLKLYIYWVLVVPFLCIGIAALSLQLLRRARDDRLRLALAAVMAVCLLGVFAEGSVARVSGLRTVSKESSYDALGVALHGYVPSGSRVVGSTSLWWGLRDTDYRSYFLFFYLTGPDAGPYRETIPEFLESFDAGFLVLTRFGEEELEKRLAPKDRAELDRYLAEHGEKLVRLESASYGYIDLWRLR